jgi:hypothetical protein
MIYCLMESVFHTQVLDIWGFRNYLVCDAVGRGTRVLLCSVLSWQAFPISLSHLLEFYLRKILAKWE